MGATVRCRKVVRRRIKRYLLREIGSLMERIGEEKDSVSVELTDYGLAIDFPCGEIYGYSSDYVQLIPIIFENVKKKYRKVGISGLVYEFETITAVTFGFYFYCEPGDKGLTVSSDWQFCEQCGEVIEGEAFYNSSQHDFEEGNLSCLCSPGCMLAYALDENWGEVECNSTFDEDEIEWLNEEEDDGVKAAFRRRIMDNLDDYLADLAEKREMLTALLKSDSVPEENKALLRDILEKIG